MQSRGIKQNYALGKQHANLFLNFLGGKDPKYPTLKFPVLVNATVQIRCLGTISHPSLTKSPQIYQ